MIRTSTLVNGLQVVTEAMTDVRSVALSFWIGTGSRDEMGHEWGMSHFLEHLLFKGSANRTALEIAQSIDAVGGDMNAFTTKECTAFYVRVLSDESDLALDILCDIMCSPAFDPSEVEAERQVVLEEILMRGDEPSDFVHELFEEAVFAQHSLSREVLGDEAGITAMDGAAIRAFFEHHYRPSNMVFAAAGDLDHDALVARLEERFVMKPGGARPVRTSPAVITGARHFHVRATDQAHVVLGLPAPNRHDPQRYAASLLDVILGGGMSSRLFQEIREKRGLAYSVYSSFNAYDDAGLLSFYVGSAPLRIAEAVDVLRAEIQKIARFGASTEELALAKRHLRATSALGLEDSGSRMSRIGRSMLFHNEVLSTAEVTKRMEAVQLIDVNDLASELLNAEPTIAAVGDLDENLRPRKGTRKAGLN